MHDFDEYEHVISFIKTHGDVHLLHVYPIVSSTLRVTIAKFIQTKYPIYFQMEVRLSRGGLVNCKKISYDKQGFGGGISDRFWGLRKHAKKSIGGSSRSTLVIVVRGTLEQMRALKESLRKIVNRGTWPIHITDSHEEAVALAEIYFNANALFVYNGRSLGYDSARFDAIVDGFRMCMLKAGVSLDNVCAVGSTPMGVAGIRENKDFDYLALDEDEYVVRDKCYSPHESQLRRYPISKKELIENPAYHFKYRGVKFMSLNVCLKLKLRRHGWPKDYKDIILISIFKMKTYAKVALARFRFFDFKPFPWRVRIVNALYRFAYFGHGISLPQYCRERNLSFDHKAYDRLLSIRPIVRIESCRIPVGKLYTRLFGVRYPMSDALPYKAMCGDVPYTDYIKKVNEVEGISDYNPGGNYAVEFLEKIRGEGFDPHHPIIINNKNNIIDGQHRSCCMLKLFGPSYQIHALRIYTLPISGSFLGHLFGRKVCGFKREDTHEV